MTSIQSHARAYKRGLLALGLILGLALVLAPFVGARADQDRPRLERLPQAALGPDLATRVQVPGTITGITLLPSSQVGIGSAVTVRVEGHGTCTVFVETNGASDDEGGFGDYQLGPGTLPMTLTFDANTAGTFQIAATGATPDGDLCVAGGVFAVNTPLHVQERAGPAPGNVELIPRPGLPGGPPGPVKRRAATRPRLR